MRTHPLNISSLVVGLIFLGLAGAWALRTADIIDAEATRWILPLLLVAAGAVGLAAAIIRGVQCSKNRTNHDKDLP